MPEKQKQTQNENGSGVRSFGWKTIPSGWNPNGIRTKIAWKVSKMDKVCIHQSTVSFLAQKPCFQVSPFHSCQQTPMKSTDHVPFPLHEDLQR